MGVHSSSVLQASLLIPLHKMLGVTFAPLLLPASALLIWGDSASSALGLSPTWHPTTRWGGLICPQSLSAC
eukprot:2338946-Amphidinium_carterae.2